MCCRNPCVVGAKRWLLRRRCCRSPCVYVQSDIDSVVDRRRKYVSVDLNDGLLTRKEKDEEVEEEEEEQATGRRLQGTGR